MRALSKPSLLQLQMGQDVLYVIMSFFILTSVILAVLVSQFMAPGTAQDIAKKLEIAEKELEVLRGRVIDHPPILTLTEADGYYFPSGSAELSDDFVTRLQQVIAPQLVDIGASFNAFTVRL